MGNSFRRRLWLIALPVASLVLIPVMLFAVQRPTAAASNLLTIFSGVAEVAHGQADFVVASDGAVLADSDRVRTDDSGHALITFFDGSTLEIEPSTTVQVEAASPNANGSITIELSQTIGRTWASVQKLTRSDSKFEVRTPTSTATVRGTAFLTEVLPSGESSVQTTEGTVAVSAQGTTVLVTQGLQTTVRPNAPPTTPGAMPQPSNTLRFGMHSPAYLVIVDALGRSCGITSPGATLVRHIPGCVASEAGSEPQIVELPNAAPGMYRTIIAAIEPGGPFTLTATGLDDRGAVSFDLALPGVGQPGAVFASALDVRTGPDGRLSASALGALVTLQGPPQPTESPSPSPIPTPTESPNVVPTLALPALPVATATVTPAPTPRTPTPTRAPTLAPTLAPTESPSPSPTASPSPTSTTQASSPQPANTSTPAPTAANTSTPAPTAAITSTPAPTAAPTAASTPNPIPTQGCTPSAGQPNKCTSSGP